MAGGKGERLIPLTEQRSKPAVPFGGEYRIVDFVVSSFLTSGIMAMYVLVQHHSQSLIEHLRRAWRVGGRIEQHFITVVPLHAASGFGAIEARRGGRVTGFEEKRNHPKPRPHDPTHAYSSMGSYIFDADLLIEVLDEDASKPGSHDFGRDLIPHLIHDPRVMAYNFCAPVCS